MLGTNKHICIPKQYYYLRGRFNYGDLFVDIVTRLVRITQEMGKYGSSREPKEFKAKRLCLATQKGSDGYCTLESVKALKGEAAKARHEILHEITQAEHYFSLMMGAWSLFPTTFKSPDPGLSPEELEINAQWNAEANDSREVPVVSNDPTPRVFYPQISQAVSGLKVILPEMFNDQGAMSLAEPKDDSDDEFITSLYLIHMAVKDLANDAKSLYESTRNLDMGKFPDELFPVNTWLHYWFNIPIDNTPDSQLEKVNFIANAIKHLPLTAVKRHKECNPVHEIDKLRRECVLDIITLIPDPHTLINYEEKYMTAHPVQSKENSKKWIRVKIPKDIHLFYDRTNKKYLSSQKELQCFRDVPAIYCTVCMSNNALEQVADVCVKGIISRKITTPPCEIKETNADSFQSEPKEVIVTEAPSEAGQKMSTTTEKLTKEIIVSNDNPSVIVEKCADKETAYDLPPTARIGVSDKCNISFINPPSVTELAPEKEYSNVRLPGAITRKELSTVSPSEDHELCSDESTFSYNVCLMRIHFHKNGYIYILVTTSSIGFFIVFLTSMLIFRKYQNRGKNQNGMREFPEQSFSLIQHQPDRITFQPLPSTSHKPYLLPIEGVEMV